MAKSLLLNFLTANLGENVVNLSKYNRKTGVFVGGP